MTKKSATTQNVVTLAQDCHVEIGIEMKSQRWGAVKWKDGAMLDLTQPDELSKVVHSTGCLLEKNT